MEKISDKIGTNIFEERFRIHNIDFIRFGASDLNYFWYIENSPYFRLANWQEAKELEKKYKEKSK